MLVVEPMLDALTKPENFLASRIYDVLQALGPKLVPVILQKINSADANGKMVMVQLLGSFGDSSVIPVLTDLLNTGKLPAEKNDGGSHWPNSGAGGWTDFGQFIKG